MGKVFILGAGASHGVGFTCYNGVKPPLLKDFFRLFNEFNYFGSESIGEKLLKFIHNKFGWSKEELFKGDPNLEEVIDRFDEAIDKMEITNDKTYKEYRWNRDQLNDFIVDTLHRTTWQPASIDVPYLSCPYHEEIAKSLSPNDFIISLNYDLIMDAALVKVKNWNYPNNYGLPFDYYFADDKWRELGESTENAYYFKLHGSLNWFTSTGFYNSRGEKDDVIRWDLKTKNKLHLIELSVWHRNDLRERISRFGANFNSGNRYSLQNLIVGPGRKKSLDVLLPLWKEAEQRLKKATEVIIAGCSLRETDDKFKDLLKNDINWNSIDKFVLIDPSEAIKEKYKTLFNRKIDMALNSMEELSSYLRNSI